VVENSLLFQNGGIAKGIRHVDVTKMLDGSFVLVWNAYASGGQSVLEQHFDINGKAISSPVEITKQNGNQAFNLINQIASISSNESGKIIIAWTQGADTVTAPNQIFVRSYDSNLLPTSPIIPLVTSSSSQILQLDVAEKSDGSFVAIWNAFKTNGKIKVSESVIRQFFSAEGTPLSPEFTLDDQPGKSFAVSGQSASIVQSESGPIYVWGRNDDTASVANTIVSDSNAIFGNNADVIDFNNLSVDQQSQISAGAGLYNSLGGDDIITLPTDTNAQSLLGSNQPTIKFDLSQGFSTGDGTDTIDFSNVSWQSDYNKSDIIKTDGGNQPDPTLDGYKQDAKVDVIKLSGSPSDYKYTVKFPSSPTDPTTTLISTPTATISETHFEKVSFTKPAVTNGITLDHNSVYSEMALLAKEVYGPLAPLAHDAEPLAYESGHDPASAEDVGNAAVDRGWHEVSALELGIPNSDIGLSLNGLHYSFVNGFYQAYNTTDAPAKPEADALVLTGIVNGKTTLAVIFRGTDQLADFTDYTNFVNKHYAKFAPLTNALKQYAATGGFQQVLIDGHSLGAGMAQIFANDLSKNFSSNQIQLFTFGSPGAEQLAPSGVNQINFVNTDDLVPQLGLLTQNKQSIVSQLKTLSYLFSKPNNPYTKVASAALGAISFVVNKIDPKSLSGDTVLLNANITKVPSLDEHNLGSDKGSGINPEFPYIDKAFKPGYINEVRKLYDYATDTASPFYYTPFAKAIKDGVAYSGTAPRIAIGDGSYNDKTKKDSIVTTYDGDEFVLGNQGVSNSIGFNVSKELVTPWNASNSPTRIIDGGSIGDNISNELVISSYFNWVLPTLKDSKTDSNGLKYYSLSGTFQNGQVETANLYRINVINDVGLLKRTLDPTSLVTHLDGKATTVQKAALGQSSLVVDGLSDVAYAGKGVTSVTSNIDHAKIAFSSDTTNIISSGASTLIVSDDVATSKAVTIDTGLGSAFIYGGLRPTTFIGHLAQADFTGGNDSSLNTIDYSGQTQDLLIDLTQGTATDGSGYDSFSNVSSVVAGQGNNYIVANSAANKFGGYNVAKSAATVNALSAASVAGTAKNDTIVEFVK